MADYTAYPGQTLRVVYNAHTYTGYYYAYKTYRTTGLVNIVTNLKDFLTAEGVTSLTTPRTTTSGYAYEYPAAELAAAKANIIDSATYKGVTTKESSTGDRQTEQWYSKITYQYTYDFKISASAQPGTYYLLWLATQYTPQQLGEDWASPDVNDLTFDGSVILSIQIYDPAIDLPEKAVLVSPAPTGVTDVDGDAGLEWLDGGLGAANAATGFDLYFAGTEAGLTKIGDSLGSGTVTATPETVNEGNYSAGETYYWRVDSFNAGGLTTGDVWSYTVFSLEFPETRPVDYDEDGASTLGGGRYGQNLVVLGHRKLYFGEI